MRETPGKRSRGTCPPSWPSRSSSRRGHRCRRALDARPSGEPRDGAMGGAMGQIDPISDEELQRVRLEPLTLQHGAITLVESDPSWPILFEREAVRVRQVLGPAVVRLEHAGSTSVPGLVAKPIIDIVLVVLDSADEPSYVPALTAAGYRLVIREPDWFEHRLFKGPDTDIHMHVFTAGA